MNTLIAMLFCVASLILSTVFHALTHDRVPDHPPLPDVVLDLVGDYCPWGLDVSEIILLVLLVTTTTIVLLHKHRWVILKRIFLITGILFLYRSITMFVTVPPKPNPSYFTQPKEDVTTPGLVLRRVLQLLSGIGLSINGKHSYAGDCMFSGHTVTLVLCYLVVKEYTPKSWWVLHRAYAVGATLGVATLLLGRGHYTVDCVVAYWLTTMLWYMYHAMVHAPQYHHLFQELWLCDIFLYFEGGHPVTQIQNHT